MSDAAPPAPPVMDLPAGAATAQAWPTWPRPAVLDALPTQGHAVVEASAGTGKTYALEHLVIDQILRAGAPLESLLVVTFTERATGELRARIGGLLNALRAAADRPPPPADQAAPDPDPDRLWILDPPAQARIDAARARFEHAPIFTIHGFCRRLLAAFPIETGLPLRLSVADGEAHLAAALRALLTAPADPDAAEALGGDPVAAALDAWFAAGHEPAALERLLRQAWHHRAAAEPGTLAPTPAGPSVPHAPVDPAVARVLDALAHDLNCGDLITDFAGTALTQPAFAAADRTARALAEALAHPDAPARLAAVAALDLSPLRRPHRTATRDKRRFPDELAPRSRAVLAHLDRLDALRAAAGTLEAQVVAACLPALARHLDATRAAGALDPDDLLDAVVRALNGPAGDPLARALRARHRLALIDEFQDTDDRQWIIFRRLFLDPLPPTADAQHTATQHTATQHTATPPSTTQGPAHTRLVLIGDPKQAIYGFRGANVHTWQAACEALQATGAPRVVLDENHRATPSLVAALNHLFDPGAAEPLFTGAIRPAGPARAAQPRWGLSDAQGAPRPPIDLLTFDPPAPRTGAADRTEVPRYVLQPVFARAQAAALAALLHPSRGLTLDDPHTGPRPLRPADVMVLVRDQFDAQDALEALQAAGLPAVNDRRTDLFQTPAAHDLLALLQGLSAAQTGAAPPSPEHPSRAGLAHHRAVQATPFAAPDWVTEAEPTEVAATAAPDPLHRWQALAAHPPSLFEALRTDPAPPARAALLRPPGWLAHLHRLLDVLSAAHVAHGHDLTTLAARLAAAAGHPPSHGADAHRLAELEPLSAEVELAPTEPGARESPDLADPHPAGPAGPIRVMTIHKSKGLQAPVVALYGGFGQRRAEPVRVLPGPTPLLLVGSAAQAAVADALARADAEEDQRLIYVALTRARSHLILPLVQTRRTVAGTYGVLNGRLRALEADHLDPTLFAQRPASDPLDAPPKGGSPFAGPPPEGGSPTPQEGGSPFAGPPQEGGSPFGGDPAQGGSPTPADAWDRHAPSLYASYSSLAHAAPTALATIGLRPWTALASGGAPAPERGSPTDPLPGGTHTGLALHACIEALLGEAPPPPAWPAPGRGRAARPSRAAVARWHAETATWLAPLIAAHGLAPDLAPHVADLLHHTLGVPLHLPPPAAAPRPEATLEAPATDPCAAPPTTPDVPAAPVIPPLARLRPRHVELPFLLPWPEPGAPGDRPPAERGFIKGFIDLVVQHDGRWYFVDWKTDRLPAYDPAALDAQVRARYGVQVALYSLALQRALAVAGAEHTFGGGIYVFLRGRAGGPPEHGLWWCQPTPADRAAWETWLAGAPTPTD